MDAEKQPLDIIILNRNIRLEDNAALYYGSLRQNYLILYVFDETYWTSNGRSPRQTRFLFDCLEELNQRLLKFELEQNGEIFWKIFSTVEMLKRSTIKMVKQKQFQCHF